MSSAEDQGQPMQRIEFKEPRGRTFSHDYTALKSVTANTIAFGDVQKQIKISESVSGEMFKGDYYTLRKVHGSRML